MRKVSAPIKLLGCCGGIVLLPYILCFCWMAPHIIKRERALKAYRELERTDKLVFDHPESPYAYAERAEACEQAGQYEAERAEQWKSSLQQKDESSRVFPKFTGLEY